MAETFDPSGVSIKNGRFFGFPYEIGESEIVLLSLPWDVTTSYRDGTCEGPQAILEASYQLDFASPYRANAWNTKIATLPFSHDWLERSRALRPKARLVIEALERGEKLSHVEEALREVNQAGEKFHQEAEESALRLLKEGKRVITVGGDHSVSLGPIRAHAKHFEKFSVLHLDAHADLRVAYEGFEHSHASIMDHVKELPQVDALVQVGLRDVSPEEWRETDSNPKIHAHYDWDLKRDLAKGKSWQEICREIIRSLGPKVYISADVDGLDPRFCPNTGTPVPGGLELWQFLFLLEEVQASGRKIIGADLVEIAPGEYGDEWDANVGARILYQLCQFVRNSLDS